MDEIWLRDDTSLSCPPYETQCEAMEYEDDQHYFPSKHSLKNYLYPSLQFILFVIHIVFFTILFFRRDN